MTSCAPQPAIALGPVTSGKLVILDGEHEDEGKHGDAKHGGGAGHDGGR